MAVQKQNDDGSWSAAEPVRYQGWKAKLELLFWRLGMKRAAVFMAKWDERILGK